MRFKDITEGEKALHTAINEVVMARAYHESRDANVAKHLTDAFDALLTALHDYRNPGKDGTQRVTFRVSREMREWIDEYRLRTGFTVTQIVLASLEHYLPKKLAAN